MIFKNQFMRNLILFFLFVSIGVHSQYWQQEIDYKIEVDFDNAKNQYSGFQKIMYTNNSPETLRKVFFHLYFNAFKPGSEMAIRQDNSADKNTRFKIDLDSLGSEQEGFLKVYNLSQNGKLLKLGGSAPRRRSHIRRARASLNHP